MGCPVCFWGGTLARMKVSAIIVCISAALVLTGCRIGGSDSTEDVLNQLRAENAELQKQVETLTQERAELQAKVGTSKEASRTLTTQEMAALPRCSSISIDSLSGIAPRTGQLDFYVKTIDGKHQFVQVVGNMSLRILKGTELVFEKKLNPIELRDAFRSNFSGTYYLIDAGERLPADVQGATFEVKFEDALTGTSHSASGTFDERGRVEVK